MKYQWHIQKISTTYLNHHFPSSLIILVTQKPALGSAKMPTWVRSRQWALWASAMTCADPRWYGWGIPPWSAFFLGEISQETNQFLHPSFSEKSYLSEMRSLYLTIILFKPAENDHRGILKCCEFCRSIVRHEIWHGMGVNDPALRSPPEKASRVTTVGHQPWRANFAKWGAGLRWDYPKSWWGSNHALHVRKHHLQLAHFCGNNSRVWARVPILAY